MGESVASCRRLSGNVSNTEKGGAGSATRDLGGVGMHESGWEAAAGYRSSLGRYSNLRDRRGCREMIGSVGKGKYGPRQGFQENVP